MNIIPAIILAVFQLFTPSTWNVDDVMDETPGYYRGEKTFSTSFEVENVSATPSKAYLLCFDGVNQEAWVRVNGDSAGYHAGGYTRFFMDITSYLHSGSNDIEVRVSNAYNENIPPLSADFTFFGGIYRKAYIIETAAAHILPDGVCVTTPVVTNDKAEVAFQTQWVNPNHEKVHLRYSVLNPQGELIYEGSKARIAIRHPQLWSPSTPVLYTLLTQVVDKKGDVQDEVSVHFGLRYYRFDPNEGFFLNGEHLKLVGTNRHQCEKGYGNALQDWQHERDIRMIKAMGSNYIRISHYPQDRRIMELCDSIGLLCSVEIPIVNGITESEAFYANCHQQLEEMIRQNRNHPSVIIWCYMNEVLLRPPFEKYSSRDSIYREHVVALAKQLDAQCKALDKERYTMIAFNSDFKYNHAAGLHQVPDIIGMNMYRGWYGGKLEDFEVAVANMHATYPDHPIIISEYGADCDARLRSKEPQRFDYTVDYALRFHKHYWSVIRDTQYVAGCAMWNFNDFHSETRGGAIPHFNLKGVVTTDRKPKVTYYYYQKELTGKTDFTDTFPTSDARNYLLGSKRYFTNTETGEVWQPMPEDWITGGEAYSVKTNFGHLPANDHDILGTELDPVYQTAWLGAKEIHIPVENGKHDVTLCLAELQKSGEPVPSVYNLGSVAEKEDFDGREFTIAISGAAPVTLSSDQLATYTAYNLTRTVEVTDGQIVIQLQASKGQTLLNAVQIK